jgi:hypothetical protein
MNMNQGKSNSRKMRDPFADFGNMGGFEDDFFGGGGGGIGNMMMSSQINSGGMGGGMSSF